MILTNIKKQNTLSRFKINDIIRLSCVALRVKDIDKTLAFYEKKLGLQRKKRDQDDDGNLVCELGFRDTVQNEEPFLQLHHDANAKTELLRTQLAFFILLCLFLTERVLLQPI